MPDQVNRAQLQYIYDAYRIAALNKKYYGRRLASYRRLNFWIEIAIAIGTTGSGGIAGLAIWGTLPGSYMWLVLSGIAAVLAVVKPVLQLADRIENYTKLYAGYVGAFVELQDICEEISVAHAITDGLKERYGRSRKILRELAPLAEPDPDTRLVKTAIIRS